MAELLKGAAVTAAMKADLTARAEALKQEGIQPKMAIVRCGERPDDLSYERGAKKRFASLGVEVEVHAFPADVVWEDFCRELQRLNGDETVHGVLILRPLPRQLDEKAAARLLSPDKDVDCMTPDNTAKVFAGERDGYAPCTPEAVMEILAHYGIALEGKKVTLIGRSLVVGKPLAMLLLARNATVTVCHTRTRNLAETARQADLVIACAGKARMVTADFVAPGQTVIDVGINVDAEGNLCGDVDFDAVGRIVHAVTPVPGGVGTVTTSVLARHVVRAAEKQAGR